MAQQHINVGTTANDGTGDTLRLSQQKAESNFTELYAMAGGGGSGDFIPLSGTTEGNPVTGDIEIESAGFANRRIYSNSGEDLKYIELNNDESYVEIFASKAEGSSKVNVDGLGPYFSNTQGGFTGVMSVNPGGVVINSNYPDAKGISGVQDYTANITDLDYTQKKYVDDAIAGVGGGAVDSVNGQTGVVVLDADDIADGTTNKAYTATEKTKLGGIATGATANDTDANLKNRANHTGTQTASTISDFNAAALSAAPAETATTLGSLINGATAKTTPVDADFIGLMDSAASNVLKKLSWANIKATLKTYFDTLYAPKATFTDYSEISTIVGWSSFTTKEIYIVENAYQYTIHYALSGTSNSTTTTFTIPTTVSKSSRALNVLVTDNSTQSDTPGQARALAGNNYVEFRRNASGTGFTGSGTKTVIGQINVLK